MQNLTELVAVGLVGAAAGLWIGMVLARSGAMDDMAAAGAYGSPPAAKGRADSESARVIRATLQTFVDGWNAHDRARMAPIFPERYIDLTVADPVIGGPAQTDNFLAMAEQSGSHLAITQQELWVSGDIAADYGLVEQMAPRDEGEAGEGGFAPYRLRYINVWRRSAADGWRIYWSMEIPEPAPPPQSDE